METYKVVSVNVIESKIVTLLQHSGDATKISLQQSKEEARVYLQQLRQAADQMQESGCIDSFAHWEGHCSCK